MNEIKILIKRMLLNELNPTNVKDKINRIINEERIQKKRSQYISAYRLSEVLDGILTGKYTWEDFVLQLREYILYFNNVEVSDFILKNIKKNLSKFNLIVDIDNEISVIKNYPKWFKGEKYLKDIYSLKSRRDNKAVTGDGVLYNFTDYKNYLNKEQKISVQASLNMPYGETLLISLPTGGGKSLVLQLTAYLSEKTILVVVPTVALAIDQEKKAQLLFEENDEKDLPYAYYGGISKEKKKFIYDGIKEGNIPIIFISPEALLNEKFQNVVLKAAKKKKISHFIIDEAHMVVDWGTSFRTEFQFLSILRKKLLKITNNKLKTILLSATLTDKTTKTLKILFSERDNFSQIRGDALRPELSFVIDRSNTVKERKDKIINSIAIFPKPLIIYVLTPAEAKEWAKSIKEKGLTRVESFSGSTSNKKREKILRDWNNDKIDIIIATSAFGMGVDKENIRTVIHCYLPESVNKFYQEVGRAGRDGFPALALLSSVIDEDTEAAFHLIKNKVLKPKTIVERWYSLMDKSIEQVEGDKFWLNADVTPFYLEGGTPTGNRSTNWNEYVLLFMLRSRLIDLLDIKLNYSDNKHQILVKFNKINLLENKEKLIEYISPYRKNEWGVVKKSYDDIKELIENPYEKGCWANKFLSVYPESNDLCQGCPFCNKKGLNTYNSNNYLKIKGNNILDKFSLKTNLSDKVSNKLGFSKELLLYYNNFDIETISKISKKLISYGTKFLIIPSISSEDWNKWVNKLPDKEFGPYLVVDYNELNNFNYKLLMGNIITVFYSQNKKENNKIYNFTQKFIQDSQRNQVIHVGNKNIQIKSENRSLTDLIDGLLVNHENLY